MTDLTKLRRNDAAGAAAAYRSMILDGDWSPHRVEALLSLQDDPDELIRLIADVNREPGVLDRLSALSSR